MSNKTCCCTATAQCVALSQCAARLSGNESHCTRQANRTDKCNHMKIIILKWGLVCGLTWPLFPVAYSRYLWCLRYLSIVSGPLFIAHDHRRCATILSSLSVIPWVLFGLVILVGILVVPVAFATTLSKLNLMTILHAKSPLTFFSSATGAYKLSFSFDENIFGNIIRLKTASNAT